MAFGQQSGPPATRSQLSELAELIEAAGHADFRDARGPLGFTQRQAGGKFTRDEAESFIDRLRAEAESLDEPATQVRSRIPSEQADPAPAPKVDRTTLTPAEKQLRRIPTPELAAELQRRGWIVVEP